MNIQQDPDYIKKMADLMEKMDRAHHFARVSVSTTLPDRVVNSAVPIGVVVGFLVGASTVALGHNSPLTDSLGSTLAAVGVSAWATGLTASIKGKEAVQLVLSAFGRSLPLSELQTKEINHWLVRFPGMLEIVGKWGAHNKDIQLNLADFKKVKRWANKAENIHTATANRIKGEADRKVREDLLQSSGLTSFIRKARLENIAEKAGGQGSVEHTQVAAKPPLM